MFTDVAVDNMIEAVELDVTHKLEGGNRAVRSRPSLTTADRWP